MTLVICLCQAFQHNSPYYNCVSCEKHMQIIMKALLVCIFLLLTSFKVTYGDLPEDYLTWADKQCIREQNLDVKMIKKAFGENLTLEEGNPIINSFVECTYKKTNYMNNDGSLNFKNIRTWAMDFFVALGRGEYIPNQHFIVDNAIAECEIIKGTDPGDTGVKVYNCLLGYIIENVSSNITLLKVDYDCSELGKLNWKAFIISFLNYNDLL
ncbi:hypothetical protein ILUMI_25572 [Ignelater luminosus]|uniref:Uncharacterized protein n=1 Tax=Ignelater luminosus TaxID=2038154 RepID=A0A8K0C9R2_IGNLU|nr:hypothetical protein ILUMI_25572 [Ignelater luminosus]